MMPSILKISSFTNTKPRVWKKLEEWFALALHSGLSSKVQTQNKAITNTCSLWLETKTFTSVLKNANLILTIIQTEWTRPNYARSGNIRVDVFAPQPILQAENTRTLKRRDWSHVAISRTQAEWNWKTLSQTLVSIRKGWRTSWINTHL